MMEILREITPETNFQQGQLILVDKPYGLTSFKIVKDIRYWVKKHFQIQNKLKVGHAGTLDPLATGLLIICTGRMTKKIDELQEGEKTYRGKFTFGVTTPSFDPETKPEGEFPYSHITQNSLANAFKAFTGFLEQTPPVHSAVKIKGQRAYDYARRQDDVEIKKKSVYIRDFQLLCFENHEVTFLIKCSKGTYIRSLARDIGEYMGSGAYLSELRRLRIGSYDVKDAFTREELKFSIEQAKPLFY